MEYGRVSALVFHDRLGGFCSSIGTSAQLLFNLRFFLLALLGFSFCAPVLQYRMVSQKVGTKHKNVVKPYLMDLGRFV